MIHNGTNGNDIFELSGDALVSGVVRGRSGYDVLKITSDTDYVFDRGAYDRLRRVEELDFTGISGALSINVKGSMLRQADGNVLTMTFGDTGPIELTAKAYSNGTLILDGEGTVSLSDAVANHVTLADNSSLNVQGGIKGDTIIAGAGGMLIDGGGGDDMLVASTSGGADTFHFETGYGSDTIQNFKATEDKIAFEGMTFDSLDELLASASEVNGDVVFDFGSGDAVVLKAVALADLDATNFTLDGNPIPDGPPVVLVQVGTTAAELNSMLAAAGDGTVFVLASGNHIFSETISIGRDNVAIRGEDESTGIVFDFAAGTGGNGIVIEGGGNAYVSTLPDGGTDGDSQITLRDGHGFQAGDAIYVQQPNTQAYLDANGWDNVSMDEAVFRPFRESIHIVESVVGNTVTLDTPLLYDMEAGEGRYYSMDVVSGVSLSGFAVTYALGQTDAYAFANTQKLYEGTSALLLNNTSGIEVSDISFTNVASTALNLSSTIGATVSGISIQGAHNKGGGGNGYGVELHEAFGNTLTELEILDMRHSLVLSAWHAEVGNVVEIANTNRDINLHGSPDHGNIIRVQNAILDFEIGGDAWALVSGGGTNHAATDFSANEITFVQGIGSEKNETIVGDDSGSVLYGAFGYDTLVGGDGDDVIIGGTRRDVMTGGNGSDTYLLVMGDDLDRITDFTWGVSGDKIVFSGNSAVQAAEDLSIYQSGDDVRVRYGSNSTVILENTLVADVELSNFEFDPQGTLSVDDFLILSM